MREWVRRRDARREAIFGHLNEIRGVVLVVLGVDVAVDNVVAKGAHEVETAGCFITLKIRWSHICGEPAKDVTECHLVVDHLGPLDGTVDPIQITMSPGVGGKLMAGIVHAMEDVWPVKRAVIDSAFASVVACYEKGGFDVKII